MYSVITFELLISYMIYFHVHRRYSSLNAVLLFDIKKANFIYFLFFIFYFLIINWIYIWPF